MKRKNELLYQFLAAGASSAYYYYNNGLGVFSESKRFKATDGGTDVKLPSSMTMTDTINESCNYMNANGQLTHSKKVYRKKKKFMDKAVEVSYCNSECSSTSGRIYANAGLQDISVIGDYLGYTTLNALAPYAVNLRKRVYIESYTHDLYITSGATTAETVTFYWLECSDNSDVSTVTQIRAGIAEKWGTSPFANPYQMVGASVADSKQVKEHQNVLYCTTMRLLPGQTHHFHLHRDINRWYESDQTDNDGNFLIKGFTHSFAIRIVGVPVANDNGTVVTMSPSEILWVDNYKYRWRFPQGYAQVATNTPTNVLSTAAGPYKAIDDDLAAEVVATINQ